MKKFITITFTIVFLFLLTTAAKRSKEREQEREPAKQSVTVNQPVTTPAAEHTPVYHPAAN